VESENTGLIGGLAIASILERTVIGWSFFSVGGQKRGSKRISTKQKLCGRNTRNERQTRKRNGF